MDTKKTAASQANDPIDDYFDCLAECALEDQNCAKDCITKIDDPQLDVHSY
jgi:hypothetical protein